MRPDLTLYLRICLFLLLGSDPFYSVAQQLPIRPAVALNKVTLYPDSSYFHHSNTFYPEGTLFEVTAETKLEHEDDAQNQKFKWYQVTAPDGKIGWLFGDGIGVEKDPAQVFPNLSLNRRTYLTLASEGHQLVLWVAGLEGRDNFHEDDFLNPLYNEYYLVLTGASGQSGLIQVAGESTMGEQRLRQLAIRDFNGDKTPELLLLEGNRDHQQASETQTVALYELGSGLLSQVFKETITLTDKHAQPIPAYGKFIGIEPQSIRVAYVDYQPCEPNEQCLEYVTYTLLWQEDSRTYEPLYRKSRSPLEGVLKPATGYLRSAPSYLSEMVEKLTADASLTVLRQFDKKIRQRGEEKVVSYLYVRSASGTTGYIHARDVMVRAGEHSALLNNYFANPPLNPADWQPSQPFLSLPGDNQTSLVTEKE